MTMLSKTLLVAGLSLSSLAGIVRGAPVSINIPNFNFASPTLSVGGYTSYGSGAGVGYQEIPDWTTPGQWDGVENGTGVYSSVPAGPNFAFDNGGTISQTLSSDLEAGTYDLTVAIGHRAGKTFPGGYLELYAGSTQLGSFTLTAPTSGAGTFQDETLAYTALTGNADLGQALTIDLISNAPGYGGGTVVDFADVSLNFTAAPEPSAWLLLLMGSGVLLMRARQIRRTSSGV